MAAGRALNPLSEAEDAVLHRIHTQWPVPNGLTRVLPLKTRRYFLAHSEGAPCAVLRLKTEKGLEEWRQREWRIFPVKPTVTDVTLRVLDLIDSILSMGREETRFVNVWALVKPDCRFVATSRGVDPPPEAVALWQLSHDDRFDIPIDLFRNDGRYYGGYGARLSAPGVDAREKAGLGLYPLDRLKESAP